MKLLKFFLVVTLLIINISIYETTPAFNNDGQIFSNDVFIGTINENTNFLTDQFNVTIYDASHVQNGLNLFSLSDRSINRAYGLNYLSILDLEGNYVYPPLRTMNFLHPEFINDTTIIYGDPNPIFWNLETNQTETFGFFERTHHDYQYNKATDSFLILKNRLIPVLNQSGQEEMMSVDNIIEFDRSGNKLFEWKLEDYTNFTWFYQNLDTLNLQIPKFKGELDPTHANAIDWIYETNTIFLNVRHFNQVYQIDKKTNDTLILGQNGNFTLFDGNGNVKDSLWYHSHDFHQINVNEFLIYDNGYHNITDPNYQKTSILRIKVDYEKMEIHEIFRWTAPNDYFSHFLGSVQLLENGNYLMSNGANHLGHEKFGGVALEIDSEGNIVWEFKLPYNWGFYRFKRFTPKLEFTLLNDQLNSNGSITLFVEAISLFPDNYSIFINDILIESFVWTEGKFQYTTPILKDGNNKIYLQVMDRASNIKSIKVHVLVKGIETQLITSTNHNDNKINFPITGLLVLLVIPLKKIKNVTSLFKDRDEGILY